jgi:predicted transcriptional regulator
MKKEDQNILFVDSSRDARVLRALGTRPRSRILELLQNQELNVGEIAHELAMPQSTTATSVQILERAGLIDSHSANGVKGGQKICSARYKKIVIDFTPPHPRQEQNIVTVEMPVGLFTSCEVAAPCGLCGPGSVIDYLDVPDAFYSPDRIKAGLIWFGQGYVEYMFPNNSLNDNSGSLKKLELSMELSSETPGTNKNWPSDISVWINGVEIGVWTSPGDFGDRRGKFTPLFWKLEGSQYGVLATWEVTEKGTTIDRESASPITLKDLDIGAHHSIKVRVGVKPDARHVGGINIFGKGFGDYDQDIRLRLFS